MTATTDQYAATITSLGRTFDTYVPTTEAVLEQAAALLITDGWCQGDGDGGGLDAQGRHCLMNALLTVCWREPHPIADRLYADVSSWLTDALANLGWYGKPDDWNDLPGRTENDVLELLAQTRTAVTGCAA